MAPLEIRLDASNARGDLERIERPTAGEFARACLRPRRPVVVRGILEELPAFSKWTPEYLREVLGERTVKVSPTDENGVANYFGHEEVSFAGLMDELRGGGAGRPRRYLTVGNVFTDGQGRFKAPVFPELTKDLPVPSILSGLTVREGNLWMGFDGVVTPLHFDTRDNVLGILSGQKRLWLFAPEETPHVYPYPVRGDGEETDSQLDLTRIDLERFPLLARARFHEVVLNPGELLFIPAGWWHFVRSSGPANTAVNFWWSAPLLQQVKTPLNRLLARRLWTLLEPRAA